MHICRANSLTSKQKAAVAKAAEKTKGPTKERFKASSAVKNAGSRRPDPVQHVQGPQPRVEREETEGKKKQKPRQTETKSERKKSKPTNWQGTARPNGKKRPLTVDASARQSNKRMKTDNGRRVLQDKSTNDDVTASRGRSATVDKGRKRAASPLPSPSPAPIRPTKRPRNSRVVYDSDDEEVSMENALEEGRNESAPEDGVEATTLQKGGEEKTPECAAAGGSTEGMAPVAQMTSGVSTASKGIKRSAAFSVGDAVAPEAKRAKTTFEISSNGNRSPKPAKKETSSSDSLEVGNARNANSNGTGPPSSTTPPSSTSAGAAGTASPSSKKAPRMPFKGIKNIGASCFSSVVIQLVDAALNGKNPDGLLAELTETDPCGITNADCKRTNSFGLVLQKNLRKVRDAVRGYASKGDADKVSVAKHLRKLLEDLRNDSGDDDISALRFQTVMADGKPGHYARHAMGGESQEDVSEYYNLMLNALDEEETANTTRLLSSFEIPTQTTFVCSGKNGCGYRSQRRTDKSNEHMIPVGQDTDLSDAWNESWKSITDKKCPGCRQKRLDSESRLTRMPDNLVINLKRAFSSRNSHATRKNSAKIRIDTHEFPMEGKSYVLSAVIMHKGMTASRGHYTIFRRDGQDWYHIDDRLVSKVSKEAIDNPRYGQCTMLLFKKQ